MYINHKNEQNKKLILIEYDAGGTSLGRSAGLIPFVQNIAGGITWTLNSIIASTNAIGSVLNLATDMGTAWGPNVPPDLK